MRKLPTVKTIIMYLFLAEFLLLICMQNSEYSLLNLFTRQTYEEPVAYLNYKVGNSLLGNLAKYTYAAHRGAPSLSKEPENSLAAFNASKEFGFKIVETDLQLTKDNQWVILHDNTLDRTTNGKGNV
ncbi:MAG: glycerophosphodiester phosphodiesterase family protein, partial [Bacillota bacterium]|nr:glycerophosphodiester phosphodiesterase family protein [Bacillota bacterium]